MVKRIKKKINWKNILKIVIPIIISLLGLGALSIIFNHQKINGDKNVQIGSNSQIDNSFNNNYYITGKGSPQRPPSTKDIDNGLYNWGKSQIFDNEFNCAISKIDKEDNYRIDYNCNFKYTSIDIIYNDSLMKFQGKDGKTKTLTEFESELGSRITIRNVLYKLPNPLNKGEIFQIFLQYWDPHVKQRVGECWFNQCYIYNQYLYSNYPNVSICSIIEPKQNEGDKIVKACVIPK